MSFTVLMCVHSRSEFHDHLFDRALTSLVQQDYQDFKVLVVLNDCHERTKSYVSSYKNILDISSVDKPNKNGLASAKNFGLTYVDSEYVMYLDADDQYTPDKILIQKDYVTQNLDVDFCFTQAWDLYPNGFQTENCFKLGQYETHEQIAARLPYENVLCHGSACIKMSALKLLDYYRTDPSVLGREDYDLWLRAMRAGYQFYNMPKRLYVYSMGTSVPR